jgi:hypothetical protein
MRLLAQLKGALSLREQKLKCPQVNQDVRIPQGVQRDENLVMEESSSVDVSSGKKVSSPSWVKIVE